MEGTLFYEVILMIVLIIVVRILYLIHKITNGYSKTTLQKRYSPARTLICIGSGGHTTEMLSIIKTIDFDNYSPRYYIIADTDYTSIAKINQLEHANANNNFYIKNIPRSRCVGQSYVSSVITTLYSILYCIPLLLRVNPDLILCNGPGTCIPVCIIAFISKAAFLKDIRVVFIESFCRTKTFSLSGKILIYFADNILVQWPLLKKKLKRAEYIGQLL